jgi:hypothetical protein
MKKLLDTFFALCQGFGIAYVIASPLLLWRANVDAKFWEKAYADSCALFTKQDSIIVEQAHMIDELLKEKNEKPHAPVFRPWYEMEYDEIVFTNALDNCVYTNRIPRCAMELCKGAAQ